MAAAGTLVRVSKQSDGLWLRADRSRAAVGDEILLTAAGSDAGRAMGGVTSSWQVERDGEWRDIYLMYSGSGGAAGGWQSMPLPERQAIVRVGLRMPVRVVVPPVEPGEYRICRYFCVSPVGGGPAVPIATYSSIRVVG